MFVTKCPCDECVPLIRGAGVTHIYTTDLDSGKDKLDISYLRFSSLKGVSKFTVSSGMDGIHTENCTSVSFLIIDHIQMAAVLLLCHTSVI